MVRNPRRLWNGLSALLCAALAGGCALTPRSQLDECRQIGQALRTENDRLKDQVLTLRSENQNIAERSVDDERRLKSQEDAIARLEESVKAYQDDRERLANAYDRLKGQIQGSASPEAAGGPPAQVDSESLNRFAHAHPGTSFSADSGVLTVPVELLFGTGGAKLRPEADGILKDLAASLTVPEVRDRKIQLAAPDETDSVQRVSHDPGSDESARLRFLAMARTNEVRRRLLQDHSLDGRRMTVADPDGPSPGASASQEKNAGATGGIVIRLSHAPAKAASSGP